MKETEVRPGSDDKMVCVQAYYGCSDMARSEELILTAHGVLLLGKTYEGSFDQVYVLDSSDRKTVQEMLQKARARIARELANLHTELQICNAIEKRA